jgi:hypothetical protein
MKLWRTGINKVMVSTSLLGCGLDYLHVRDVIHRGPSFTMLDQYQEDSRGGRDGLECGATTFVSDDMKIYPPENTHDLGFKVLIDSMNDKVTCRRMAPTLYLDGRAVQCVTLPGAVYCQNCSRSAPSSSVLNPLSPPGNSLSRVRPPQRQPSQRPELVNDIFNPSFNHIDFINTLKLPKRSSTSSSSHSPTSSKKQKVSNFTVPEITTPFSPTATRTSRPFGTPLLLSTSNAVFSTSNSNQRSTHTAGILARQRPLQVQDSVRNYKTQVIQPVRRAFNILKDKCVMCWIGSCEDWKEHESDNCRGGTGTHFGDPEFVKFRKNAFRLPAHWCFSCHIHQVLLDFHSQYMRLISVNR